MLNRIHTNCLYYLTSLLEEIYEAEFCDLFILYQTISAGQSESCQYPIRCKNLSKVYHLKNEIGLLNGYFWR